MTWELWNYGAEKVLRSLHYKLHHLFMNVSIFTSSHHFSLKNWTSVMLMHLGSPVHNPTSWVMKGGHSSKRTPSWSLGHSCGIVLLKSIISDGPLMAHLPDGNRRGSYPDQASLKVCSEAIPADWSLLLWPFIDFYVPNSMHQIPLLFQILRGSCSLTRALPDTLALIHAMLTTTLQGSTIIPYLQSGNLGKGG